MQQFKADSEPRHSTDFRTIFEIMIGLFVLRNFEQTCFTYIYPQNENQQNWNMAKIAPKSDKVMK